MIELCGEEDGGGADEETGAMLDEAMEVRRCRLRDMTPAVHARNAAASLVCGSEATCVFEHEWWVQAGE